MAVRLLYALADLIGISYEEINVWIFVIIGPLLLLASLFANIVLWRRRQRGVDVANPTQDEQVCQHIDDIGRVELSLDPDVVLTCWS